MDLILKTAQIKSSQSSLRKNKQKTYTPEIYHTLPETNIAPENGWLED